MDVEGLVGVDVDASVSGAGAITFGAITGTLGTATITANSVTGSFAATTVAGTTVTATHSGSGNVNLGAITSTTTTTIDASSLTGELTVDLGAVGTTATVTTGAGGVTSITTSNGAATNNNVTFGASNAANDHVILNATAVGSVDITNFKAGSVAGDSIDLSNGGIEGRTSQTDILANVDGTTITTATVDLLTVTAAIDLDTLVDNVIVLSGDFASSGLVETALETSGSREITVGLGFTTDESSVVVAWDDGTNSYIGVATFLDGSTTVATSTAITDGETIDALTVTTLVTLTGVSDVTTLTVANFGGAFIA